MLANRLATHIDEMCPKRVLTCPNDGCDVSIPADQFPDHRAVCPCEAIKCGFGGDKCDGTYKRGVGSGDHDREATRTHLNIAMTMINT
jgi:hypothetical protein